MSLRLPPVLSILVLGALILSRSTGMLAATPPHRVFYAAPDGRGSGTLESPMAIDEVPTRIRESNQKMAGDIVVYLRGGEYRLQQPLRFGAFHSGYTGHSVIIAAHQDEVPVLSGAWRVREWSEAGPGLVRAQVGPATFRNMFVNGRRAVRARTPNAGTYGKLVEWRDAQQRVVIDRTLVSDPGALKGATFVTHRHWAGTHLRVERANVTGDLLLLEPADPWRTVMFSRLVPKREPQQAFFVENSRAFLDAEGEWFHDTVAGVLYYQLRAGESAASLRAEIPMLERLVEVAGEPHLPVHDIEFRGVHFRHGAWNFVNREQGLLEGQNGWNYGEKTSGPRYFWEKQGAAVVVRAADRIRFRQCVFSGSDATALAVENWTSRVTIEENVFRDLGGCAVMVGLPSMWETRNWFPANPAEVPTGHVIRRNLITQTGVDCFSSSSISAAYVRDVVIEENDISRNPYSGINVGCGWTSAITATANNIIRKNAIHEVMQVVDDGGAIYTLSAGPGNRIEGNHIFGLKKSPWAQDYPIAGIYLDEGGEGMLVQRNVLEIDPAAGAKMFNLNRTGMNTFVDNGASFEGSEDVKKSAGLGSSALVLRARLQALETGKP